MRDNMDVVIDVSLLSCGSIVAPMSYVWASPGVLSVCVGWDVYLYLIINLSYLKHDTSSVTLRL